MQPTILGTNVETLPDSWGTGITQGTPILSLFKLALLHCEDLFQDHERQDSIDFVRQCTEEVAHAKWTGSRAVAKYLDCLWADAKPRSAVSKSD